MAAPTGKRKEITDFKSEASHASSVMLTLQYYGLVYFQQAWNFIESHQAKVTRVAKLKMELAVLEAQIETDGEKCKALKELSTSFQLCRLNKTQKHIEDTLVQCSGTIITQEQVVDYMERLLPKVYSTPQRRQRRKLRVQPVVPIPAPDFNAQQ